MQGFPGSTRAVAKGAIKAPVLIFNPKELSLDDRKIVVERANDGGYLCVGFGSAAQFLRRVDDDPDFGKAVADRMPSGRDPFLSRLTAAVALAKDYDPQQPRDDHGRWSGDGAAGSSVATAGSIASAALDSANLFGAPVLVPALKQLAARLLGAAGPVAFFSTLFLPTNRGLISEGALPDAPDFSYRFDQGTGVLTLSRQHDDGASEILFSGRYDADGVFRDEDGNAIGRHLSSSVALDADAIRGYEARAKSSDQSNVGTAVQTDTATHLSDPKLCPDPDAESLGNRKERGLRYQSQITGLPPGLQFKLVDPATNEAVSFDGCDLETGTMLEAKGPGYLDRMNDSDSWQGWYRGLGEIEWQMERQSRAGAGRQVEWHFAEEQVADYFRRYEKDKYPNINIFYTPAR